MARAPRVYCVSMLIVLAACQSAVTPPAPTAGPAPAVAPKAPASAPPAGAAAAGPATGGLPRALDPPVTVRVGALSSISDSGIYIGYERGYFRELGLDVQLETIPDP